jgi:arylsulfatase A
MGRRGTKRYNFDSGVRVPMLARWPGKIAAGTICDNRAVVYDIMPTVAELGSVAIAHPIDGISFLPTLLGEPEKQQKHEYLYWAGNDAFTRAAILAGDWKLIEERDLGRSTKKNAVYQWALYDLKKDPVEENNQAAGNPERVNMMLNLVKKARKPLR